MSSFEFDHELIFATIFDPSVITNSQLPDKSSDFQSLVEEEFNKIYGVLTLHPGVSTLASFVLYNSINYKITVTK